ncbi:flagellar biosynthesis protein FliQ [uncultured Desulfobacter sp.]|uniref:flagellar biosynthesis protein FliQ n=1 Tax=uncultured Desulfobacter sp. TaxID=240139 RepID=UPI0029F537A8|nr:flagellar biosynthesis protein FliQ [uncultured Desulfobacter sp.]
MTPEFILAFAKQAITLTILLAMPMLGLGLIAGLAISVFQAVTQIQEMTLTFVPKILAVFIGLLFAAPWMMEKLMAFTTNVITNIPMYIR